MTAGLLIALVVLQLGALTHKATARHITCEHGELVESPLDDGAVESDGARLDREIAHGSHADHEHCSVANAFCGDQALPSPTVVAIIPGAAIATHELPATPWIHSEAQYRIAPKTSPPA